jgi:hypothetical protein
MRVIVASVRTPFVQGGAEIHAEQLINALLAEGHQAELVTMPFDAGNPERIPDQMLACALMDSDEINGVKVDRLIALKFPAYLMPHPNKVVWLMHQHRPAYDLWNNSLGNLHNAVRGVIVVARPVLEFDLVEVTLRSQPRQAVDWMSVRAGRAIRAWFADDAAGVLLPNLAGAISGLFDQGHAPDERYRTDRGHRRNR